MSETCTSDADAAKRPVDDIAVGDAGPSAHKLAHDLRGPLVTIEGFVGEIAAALDELEVLIAEEAPATDVATQLGVLLEADLRPCIDFVTRATSILHNRIDKLTDDSNADA